MTRRFYAPPEAFNFTEQTVTLGTTKTRHLRDVLRLKTADEVYVFDGLGREFRCTVSSIKRDEAELQIEAQKLNLQNLNHSCSLICASRC
jgi:16S rRNA (uracil1498-N3)-methyltransferase